MKKIKIIFTQGPTPKPPKGGLNSHLTPTLSKGEGEDFVFVFKPLLGVWGLVIVLLLNSCKEVGPVVPWGKNGNATFTTYIESPVQQAQSKNALIEEVTGVSCVNCPAGHIILDTLINQNNKRVIGVTYHLGAAMVPILEDAPPGTLQNMTSTDAQSIASYFSFPGSVPAGAVDRISHAITQPYGSPGLWDIPQNWSGYVSTQLAETTPVNLNLSALYNSSGSTRQISIAVGLHYTATQSDTDKLSIFLTEDSIVTAQLLANGADDTFYVHNHIMRAAVTNALGDIIAVPSFVAGRVDSLTYTYTIPAANAVWNPAHMNVVAFVHKYQNGKTDILQSQIVQLSPH